MATAGNITAVLTLNSSGFTSGLSSSTTALDKFKNSIISFNTDTSKIERGLESLRQHLNSVRDAIILLNDTTKNAQTFNQIANGVDKLARGLKVLGGDLGNTKQAMSLMAQAFTNFKSAMDGVEVKISGLDSALKSIASSENNTKSSTQQMSSEFKRALQDLTNLGNAVQPLARVREQADMMKAEFQRARQELMNFARYGVQAFNNIDASSDALKSQIASMNAEFERSRAELMEFARYGRSQFGTITAGVQQYESALQVALPTQRQLITNNVELANAERQKSSADRESASTSQQVASAEEKQSVATDRATNSMNRQTTATNRLGKAMSSLKMIGTMVASMMVWNFASNLVKATRETVNAKSEMEGYFQMLNFSTGQVDKFNKALDETVAKFPRLNKYALGETISSIGVEFELTTKEMEKAMPVVSMITSEYLRAGRNVNEASLAVKDILQGEFQRLSRETGVKGDQLKEAGWSGDKNDVMGLLEALDKVGRSRNWDTFVVKANSLNDAVLILQNRFGEWSADMVNVVQPTILSVFNSLLSFSEGLSQSLTATWQWLNGGSWEASATQIGLLGGALLTVSQALVQYRTGMGLAQTAQLGLRKQLASLILGLKGQEIAEVGVRNAIMGKILGVKAEVVAERGLTRAIQEDIIAQKLATIEEQINTASTGENTLAKELNTLQTKLEEASTNGLISAKAKETIENELNTTAKELGTLASIEQEGANIGLTASLYALGTGEIYVAGETTALATTMGVLNGVIALSPVGWFIGAILALASAFYVLSGGLSETWGQMKQFHEVMKDPHDTINTYKNKVNDLTTKLEEAKSKYGENSSEAQKLQTKLDNAKETLEGVQGAVEHGVYWNDKYNESFEELGVTMDSSLREVMKGHGYSKEQIDKAGQLLDSMDTGTNKTYHALQVLVKQQDDAKVSMDDFAKSLDDAGIKGEEATDKLSNYAGHLQDLQTHSAIANTTDDWWEWLWNSFYAGLDQMWIDMDEFFINFDLSKLLNENGLSILDSITGFFEGKTLMDLLGLDENKDYIGDFAKWLGDQFGSYDWVGAITSSLTGINVVGAILDAILPAPASASDGSSDHPSFMEDLSNIIGVDVQTWVNNFNSDPLGTLGIQLPPIDIMGLINPLIPTVGNGGFDIGGWLSSLFNIDGIVSTFTTNLQTIFTTASTISTNVGNIFGNLRNIIWGHIQTILSNITNTFTNIKNTAINQINGLSSGIQGGIDKVKDAFNYMKDSILNSAKAIYNGVKSKFDGVKNTIGDFWHNLTNPSSWGSAGSESYQRRSPKPQTARRMFSPVVRSATHHGAGINPYQNDSQTVKLKDLMDMVNGDNKVRLSDFLAMFSSGGFGTWDFHEPVKKKVFDTAKGYKTGSPNIKGIGTVGDGYQVSKFWDGKPSFSFDEFMAVAQAIFSAIPYKFYYDSEWKGNWVNALLSGATNCSDGSDALIALARVFGFDGYKQHTTLKSGVGHFFAVINGRKMDTTNFQNHGSWSPLGGAGIPTRTASYRGYAGETQGKTVNITVSMDNATVYGVEDLDNRIQESVRTGLREEFNDPYTVSI